MIKNYVYFCEGPCEEALINALKKEPSLIEPGRARTFNVIQNQITNSILLSIKPGSVIVFVFDTDKELTDKLKKNIAQIAKVCPKSKMLYFTHRQILIEILYLLLIHHSASHNGPPSLSREG